MLNIHFNKLELNCRARVNNDLCGARRAKIFMLRHPYAIHLSIHPSNENLFCIEIV
jgi:hypothetical protein